MSKPKRDFRTASKEAYKLFRKAHPELAKKVNSTTYIAVVKKYNEALIKYALDTGNQIFLPYNFGVVCVHRKPQVNFYYDEEGNAKNIMPIDWVKSKELGKRVYILNNHTEGFRYRFLWRSARQMAMRGIWEFHPTREASRELARRLKEETATYMYKYHDWQRSDNQTKHKNR